MKSMIHLPTVKQLRYLVALAEHKHFGKAAQACFVSQSAFSIAIKELESLLSVRLIDRTKKSVTVTTVGQEVVAQARLCLNDVRDIVEIARRSVDPLSGTLKLGVIPTIAPFLLPKILPKLRAAFPKLDLYLKEDITDKLHLELLAGNLDLILVAIPYDLKNVELLHLFDDHFLLACRTDTQLVDPENFSYNCITRDSILLLEDGHCLRDHVLSACRIRDSEKISKFASTSIYTLLQMVDSDLGITFLPEMGESSAMLKGTRIKTYPLKDNSYRRIALGWRKASTRGEEYAALGEVIKKNR